MKPLHRALAALFATFITLSAAPAAFAQDPPDEPDEPAPPPSPPPAPPSPGLTPGPGTPAVFPGALQTLRGPQSAATPGATPRGPEIFPDASRLWMNVRDTDALPIEAARRGGPWYCTQNTCSVNNGDPGRSKVGDAMLRSIKLQTPTLPLPLTIWGRTNSRGERVLDFDPVLIAHRSYSHVCAYKPVEPPDPKNPKQPEKILVCRDGVREPPLPDTGELILGMQWPRESELADFRYLAIVDSCGNAQVQPFQRTFTVPVIEVASGGCGQPDGRVLRVFPQGGWLRVTAFNLDAPAAGNVLNATYRVTLPALENMVESSPARLLFPDPVQTDLQVDCGPSLRKALPDASGIPRPRPPGPTMYEVPPDPAVKEDDKAPPNKPPPPDKPLPNKPPPPPDKPPPAPPPGKRAYEIAPTGPGPQPLAHQAVVIAPEPLRQGNCKVRLMGQTKRRLVAPLALHVSLTRTDKTLNGTPVELLTDGRWIVTPSNPEFPIPPLAEGFDGDSRLRLTISADPLSPNGKVVLLSDAGRVATSLRSSDRGEPERARRLIGSVVIHSVPICGQPNFESLETSGSCLRAYITIPAMLAMVQVTRAPWLERPLITRNVFSAVGAALAFDAYNPVERKAFPIAGQVGGMFENLGDGRLGLLAYVGVAPTIPILGSGGNTTSIGLLGGVGVAYVINEKGPDEGVKPAAFLSVLVAVGQANPWVKSGGP
jgi:hypothetical protein